MFHLLRTLRLIPIYLCLCFALLRAEDPPPLSWQERGDVGSPGQIEGAAMAFDGAQGVTLLFGGEKSVSSLALGVTDALWQYDGVAWVEVTVTGPKPTARSGHALVYDPVAQRVLLFGGDAGGGVYLNDLWAFEFAGPAAGAWVRLADLPSAGRWGAAMGYDAGRDRFVVVGGIKQGTAPQDTPSGAYSVVPATRETWEWDRVAWSAGPPSALYNNGPFCDAPEHYVMAGPLNGTLGYHPEASQLFLFAERAFPFAEIPIANYGRVGGVSRYDGAAWGLNTGGYQSILAGNFPTVWRIISESRIQSAYDPVRGRLIVAAGGVTQTFEYAGTHWAEPSGTDPLNPYPHGRGSFGSLPNRPRFCLAHDTARGVTVFFGGKEGVLEAGDTWELLENPAIPFSITTDLVPTRLEPCAGETLTLTAGAAGSGPLRVRWFRNGEVIPGVTAFTFQRMNLTGADSGDYTFEVMDTAGRALASQVTEVFVHEAPVVTQPPTARRVVPGETFSVEAAWTSTLPVTVQWYKDAAAIPGATSPVYTKANATVEDAGNYVVFLTTRCTTVSSGAGRVLVGPVVNQHPVAAVGESVGSSPVGMRVTADGVGAAVGTYTTGGLAPEYVDHAAPDSSTHPRPLTFTWRHEGVPIVPGPRYTLSGDALSSNLVINQPDHEDEGYYDCVVTDISGAAHAKTTVKTLLILNPLAPPYLTIQNTGPDPRVEAGMVYDSRRGRTVLFGGTAYGYNPRSTFNGKTNYVSDDTWEWDGKVWVLRHPAHRPPALTGFGITYDWRRGRVVVFGGYEYQPPAYALGTQVLSNKVWEWDGSDWSQIVSATPAPPARNEMSLCYDGAAGEVLMIGGNAFSPAQSNQHAAINALWAWDGTAWSSRATLPVLGFNAAPYMYPGNEFVFDEERGVAVLFGPFFDSTNPVWEWDGSTWRKVTPPSSLRLPDSRAGGAAFYDPVRRRVAVPLLSNNLSPGTASPVSSLVYWDGAAFSLGDTRVIDDVTGAVYSPYDSAPVFPGQGDLTAFDSARRALVWLDNQQFYYQGPSTTREMHFSAKAKPVHAPAEVVFFPNQTFSLRVISAGQRGLTQQWFKDGVPVLDDGRVTGGDQPTLTIRTATSADAGVYRLRVGNVYNQVFARDIVVRWQDGGIAIAGVPGGGAVTLFWPGTTGVLETTTNLAGPWTRLLGATSPYSGATDERARFYRVVYP